MTTYPKTLTVAIDQYDCHFSVTDSDPRYRPSADDKRQGWILGFRTFPHYFEQVREKIAGFEARFPGIRVIYREGLSITLDAWKDASPARLAENAKYLDGIRQELASVQAAFPGVLPFFTPDAEVAASLGESIPASAPAQPEPTTILDALRTKYNATKYEFLFDGYVSPEDLKAARAVIEPIATKSSGPGKGGFGGFNFHYQEAGRRFHLYHANSQNSDGMVWVELEDLTQEPVQGAMQASVPVHLCDVCEEVSAECTCAPTVTDINDAPAETFTAAPVPTAGPKANTVDALYHWKPRKAGKKATAQPLFEARLF